MLLILAFSTAFSVLAAVNVDTTLLGSPTGPPPLTAADAQGNLVLAASTTCSILQECQPITLVKVDPTGRVLFRRSLGDSSWRLQPFSLAVDRTGNILLAGTAGDANLPTVRPVQPRPGGGSDLYFLQLSPDGATILFATYFGGNGNESLISLQTDAAGNIGAVFSTTSTDLTFNPPAGAFLFGPSFLAAVRILPATGRVSYLIQLPEGTNPSAFHIAPDGTALMATIQIPNPPGPARPATLEIRPDGTRRVNALGLPGEALPIRIAQAPDGGLWLAGLAAGGALPVTANAWQKPNPSSSYVRSEGPQVLTPPGLMRNTVARYLAVDPADDNTIYSATNVGVARTADNGWTWEIVNDAPFARIALAFSAGAGRLWLITGVTGPGLRYSDDGGVTWTATTFPAVPTIGPLLLAAHPTNKKIAFLAYGNTLYRTSDSGETWLSRQFPNQVITALAADEKNVALSTAPQQPGRAALHFSDDGGESFSETAPLNIPAQVMRFDPNQPGSLYIADGPRLVRTGAGLFPRLEELPPSLPPFVHFGFQNGLPGVILAYSFDGTLYRSEDSGRTFRPASPPQPGQTTGQFPAQMVVAAGGVVHLIFLTPPEPFVANFAPNGDLKYLSYLGIRRLMTLSGLHVQPNGQAVLTGQMDTSVGFPGDLLRGTLPGGFVPSTTSADIFAIALGGDGTFSYAVSLAGVGPDSLLWSGAGPNASLLLFGLTASPDFPGVFTPANTFQQSYFFSRLRP